MAETAVEVRSRTMRAVKSRDTKPEMTVRRMVYAMGKRYRLHRPDLPGKPDLTFSGLKKIIFVHGCFWHGHDCKRGARSPKQNASYWLNKITRNQQRDAAAQSALQAMGWDILVLWECMLGDKVELQALLKRFLEN